MMPLMLLIKKDFRAFGPRLIWKTRAAAALQPGEGAPDQPPSRGEKRRKAVKSGHLRSSAALRKPEGTPASS